MRNTVLSTEELPITYTHNGISFNIKDGTTNKVYFNSTKIGANYSDWTTAGIQYYLNASDGYWGTISNNIQNKVDSNYSYYLGNVTATYTSSSTTIESYKNERKSKVCLSSVIENSYNNDCNIWYGNQATWSGKVALLYPSDYGYSAKSSYWNTTTFYKYNNNAYSTSWMMNSTDHKNYNYEWLISPSSIDNVKVIA